MKVAHNTYISNNNKKKYKHCLYQIMNNHGLLYCYNRKLMSLICFRMLTIQCLIALQLLYSYSVRDIVSTYVQLV